MQGFGSRPTALFPRIRREVGCTLRGRKLSTRFQLTVGTDAPESEMIRDEKDSAEGNPVNERVRPGLEDMCLQVRL